MNKQELLDPLLHFLRIQSVSTQEKYLPEMQKAQHFLTDLFTSMGFKTKALKGVKHDAILAELTTDQKLPTVLIYGHYDVQPPEPLEEWKTPPFEPITKGKYLYARGASDNKGQIMIHIMAVKKLIEKSQNSKYGRKLPVNFKFIIEGEEEIGSPSIEKFARKYSKDLLRCDYLVVSDSGMSKEGQPAIDISLRGLLYTEVTIQTGTHDLHSGTFGGVAENPAILLARLISNLKDENGKIKIPGFYEDVVMPKKSELKRIKKESETYKDIIKEGDLFGVGGGEPEYSIDERKWVRPTLDVNGIWGGYTGEGSKTIIPFKASAKISMRLVPNQDPDKIFKLFEKYVKTLVPRWVKLKIARYADCYPYQVETDNPVFKLMGQSLKKYFGKAPKFERVSGSIGFVPIMAKALNAPVLMVGFALPGDNAHGPNEWFSLKNYYKGIQVFTHFYSNLDKLKPSL